MKKLSDYLKNWKRLKDISAEQINLMDPEKFDRPEPDEKFWEENILGFLKQWSMEDYIDVIGIPIVQ